MRDRLVIYTVAMGTEYQLPDPIPGTDVEYICFTNVPDLLANGWTIRHVDPLFPFDLVRSSREQKTRPHRWLADFDRSIYVDTTVQLTGDPNGLWDYLIPDKATVFGAFHHSFRASVEEEFGLVKGKGFEDRTVLAHQLNDYRATAPEMLQHRPIWGGVLARRHNDPVLQNAMETWFAHILRYARRDQLSLVLAVSGIPDARVALATCNNHLSDFHKWPVGNPQKPTRFFAELNKPGDSLWTVSSRYLRRLKQRLI